MALYNAAVIFIVVNNGMNRTMRMDPGRNTARETSSAPGSATPASRRPHASNAERFGGETGMSKKAEARAVAIAWCR